MGLGKLILRATLGGYFFGHGIIDPVDDIRASNPPSNPKTVRLKNVLYQRLARDGGWVN